MPTKEGTLLVAATCHFAPKVLSKHILVPDITVVQREYSRGLSSIWEARQSVCYEEEE